MQASQHYVSKKVSWFTGGFFGQLFQIDPEYGANLPCDSCHRSNFLQIIVASMKVCCTKHVAVARFLFALHGAPLAGCVAVDRLDLFSYPPWFCYGARMGCIDAVRRKLVLLMLPFLGKYDYMRQAENMATPVPTMKPPRDDLFAPDLYIPLHAVFTYVVLSACNRFMSGSFKPDVMYNMVCFALCATGVLVLLWHAPALLHM